METGEEGPPLGSEVGDINEDADCSLDEQFGSEDITCLSLFFIEFVELFGAEVRRSYSALGRFRPTPTFVFEDL